MEREANNHGKKQQFLLNNKGLIISSILNLLIHIVAAVIYFNPIDFVLQVETARQLAQGRILYFNIDQIVFEGNLLPNPQYPPLYLYTLAILIFFIGVNVFTFEMAKFFLISVNMGVGLFLYYLVNRYINRNLALLSFNWFLLNPSSLGVVLGGYHENFMLLFVLFGYLYFIKSRQVFSGIFFGLALLVKPTAGIYLIPILIWGIKNRDLSSIQIWLVAAFTFLLFSLPFLIRTPSSFIQDVFLIHSSRLDPSMSFYTYFLTDLSPTLFPFLVQSIIFLLIGAILYTKASFQKREDMFHFNLPFVAVFLAFNRILYPHYIPFIFPFLTWTLILLLTCYKDNQDKLALSIQIIGILGGLGVVYIGCIWWSILWVLESYQTYLTNIFFPLTAGICILGLLILSLVSLYTSITINTAYLRSVTNDQR